MEELSKLKWRCRRGMRELDVALHDFLAGPFADLDAADKRRFDEILNLQDPDLYGYIVLGHEPEDPDTARVVALIRRSVRPAH